jgi:NADPH2:quinone reductase
LVRVCGGVARSRGSQAFRGFMGVRGRSPRSGFDGNANVEGAGNLNGRRVLVTGAAGGVGRYLVQLAAAQGAYVVAIARGERRHTAVLAERADLVITAIDELDDDEFDLVLDSVGGVSLAHAMRVVAPGGVVTSFGNSSRTTTDLNVSSFYPKQANLRGFYVLADIDRNAPAEDLAALAALTVSGRLITDVALVASWSDAISVLSQLRDRHVDGKAVLRTGSLR